MHRRVLASPSRVRRQQNYYRLYGASNNQVLAKTMTQLITWDQCFLNVANQHFNASFVTIWLVVLAACILVLYQLFSWAYAKYPQLKTTISEDLAESIWSVLLQFAAMLLVAFVLYFFFVFRPDAVQVQADALSMAVQQGYATNLTLPVFQ